MNRLVVLSLAFLVGSCNLFSDQGTDPLRVDVDGGILVGAWSDDEQTIRVFKGIPYAAPPVGPRRWAPPAPVEPWAEERPAHEPGPACMQIKRPADSFYGPGAEKMSEDCLYLNIWASVPASEARPVLVWIHGGGLRNGWGANPAYDGEALARRGAVVVTINYRLGLFGFFAHPALSGETGLDASGNWAILDQIVALQWVQRNIAAFGGDATRVTIFGESAGSRSVNYLMASPLARGLFHRAIGESSATFGDALYLRDGADGDSAEEQGQRLARLLLAAAGVEVEPRPVDEGGEGRTPEETELAALRALSAEQMLVTLEELGAPVRYEAIIDGWVLPTSTWQVFSSGRQASVPVIVGWNADEGTAVIGDAGPQDLASFRSLAKQTYGPLSDEFLSLYPASTDEEARDAFVRALGASRFGWDVRTWARLMETVGSPAYLYYFRRVPPGPGSDRYGAFHAAEIPYLFGNLQRGSRPYEESDRRLSELMGTYLLNFAATGNPNGAGLPEWPPFIAEKGAAMVFDSESRAQHDVRSEELDFFDRFQKRRR